MDCTITNTTPKPDIELRTIRSLPRGTWFTIDTTHSDESYLYLKCGDEGEPLHYSFNGNYFVEGSARCDSCVRIVNPTNIRMNISFSL